MPSLRSIFSVKNGIRFSGVIALAVGSPMIIAPALAVNFWLGKRAGARDPDKKACNVIMRSNGIAIFAAGLKALLAKPTVPHLVADATMEGMYALYHTWNRTANEWKDAEGNMTANAIFLPLAWCVFLAQVAALSLGDRSDDQEKDE